MYLRFLSITLGTNRQIDISWYFNSSIMDKGKHKMDQNGTSPSILPGPLIHSIMDSNDHTHVVGVQLVSLGSGWSIELLLWRVPDVQKQWLGKATNDSMGARPDSVKNASNHKRRKHANVCCKCMPTCICYTYTYVLHTHKYIYIHRNSIFGYTYDKTFM